MSWLQFNHILTQGSSQSHQGAFQTSLRPECQTFVKLPGFSIISVPLPWQHNFKIKAQFLFSNDFKKTKKLKVWEHPNLFYSREYYDSTPQNPISFMLFHINYSIYRLIKYSFFFIWLIILDQIIQSNFFIFFKNIAISSPLFVDKAKTDFNTWKKWKHFLLFAQLWIKDPMR